MGAHFDRGIVLYKLKNYKQAEKEFRDELTASPQSASAHAMLGMTLNVMGKPQFAHEEAKESARLSPSYAYAHYTLSYTLAALAKYPEAQAAIMEAIRLAPYESYLFARASQLCQLRREFPKALEYADQGIKCNALDDDCFVHRAHALMELNRLPEAKEAVSAALSINAENQSAHLRMGDVQLRLGDRAAAFDHYREALRLKPSDSKARVGALSALKSRNSLYHAFLMLTINLRRIPGPVIAVLAILIIVPPLRALAALMFLLALTLAQLHTFVLRFDKQFRPLMTKEEIKNNNLILGFGVLVVTSMCIGITADISQAPHFKDDKEYMVYIEKRIKGNWDPKKMDHEASAMVRFHVAQDGEVSNLRIKRSSGDDAFDHAALDAVDSSKPLPALPQPAPHPVPVDFTFDYHVHNTETTDSSNESVKAAGSAGKSNGDEQAKSLLPAKSPKPDPQSKPN